MMYRMLFLSVLLVLFSCSAEYKKERKPNILLISADDLGWSDLGCYGSDIQTPNLDQLAKQGMRFTQFHNTSKCFPSRACLITGVYAHDCGYSDNWRDPIRNAVTIGEVLQEAGYLTYWSGKHHGGENPYYRGFDHYYGLKDGCCNYFNPGKKRAGEPQPAQKRNNRQWCIDSLLYQPYTPEAEDFYTTDYFTRYALDYIQEAHDSQQPFFLYLAYTAPHDPLMAWPEDIKTYEGKFDQGYEAVRKRRYQKQLEMGLIDEDYALSRPTYTRWQNLSPEEKEYESAKMEVYAAMIDRMDQNIGRIIQRLEENRQIEHTIIMFVSDNGASAEVVSLNDDDEDAPVGSMERWTSLGPGWANVSNTPFRYYKNDSYEGGINTPLIVYWPGTVAPNSFSEVPGHFIDIMPTLVEITGAAYPERHHNETIIPMKGISLVPALKGGKLNRTEPLYWDWARGQAMRLDQWKIVKKGLKKEWDLYDMEADPTETRNLASEHPEKVRELDSIYQAWISRY